MRRFALLSLALVSLVGCTPSGAADTGGETRSSSSASSAVSVFVSSSVSSIPTSQVSVPADSTVFDPLAQDAGAKLPASIQLDVPFTPQAPFANWDPPFDEACEEASLLTVEFFLRGDTFTPEKADTEIRAMYDWETSNGYPIDITTNQLAEVAQKYLKRTAKVYSGSEVTIDNIKRLLAAGYPVIIPAAGQDLGNPYFSGDGPPYHMLVITGYTRFGNFITNDPGTKRGEDYSYDQDLLVRVIHDWNGSVDTIRSGGKAMMVVQK